MPASGHTPHLPLRNVRTGDSPERVARGRKQEVLISTLIQSEEPQREIPCLLPKRGPRPISAEGLYRRMRHFVLAALAGPSSRSVVDIQAHDHPQLLTQVKREYLVACACIGSEQPKREPPAFFGQRDRRPVRRPVCPKRRAPALRERSKPTVRFTIAPNRKTFAGLPMLAL